MRYLIPFLSLFLFNCSTELETDIIQVKSPAGSNSSLSKLYTDNSGAVFMSWVEQQGDSAHLYYSKFENHTWAQKQYISGSDNWFVNWADYPSIIARNGEVSNAHWLEKVSGGTYAYHVKVASASDDWSTVRSPHTDNTPTEHGFVSMIPVSDSTFMSVWLDGRNTSGHGGHDNHDTASPLSSAMTMRSAILNKDLDIKSEHLIDDSVCDCCATAAVKTKNGYIVAYRNRTEDEIRDIYVSRFENDEWTEPVLVHNDGWNIAACPVNGPALASKTNEVAVAWYSAANDSSIVKLALSNDGGKTFGDPLIVDQGDVLGRVDVEFTDENTIAVSWMKRNQEDRSKAEMQIMFVDKDFNPILEQTVATTSSSRKSGFPQITNFEENLMISWTDFSKDDFPEIKTKILRIR